MNVAVILKENVQKVILNTRSFWEFESATNELTYAGNLAYEKILGVLNFTKNKIDFQYLF